VLHTLFWRRFLLVTFDAEAAKVAGVRTRRWALGINLLIGAIGAGAVHEIGALSTFALLTLPAMAALLVTSSIGATFMVASGLGFVGPVLALIASFYFDLPAAPPVRRSWRSVWRWRQSPLCTPEGANRCFGSYDSHKRERLESDVCSGRSDRSVSALML
jgi:hypothetical protein